MCNKSFQVIAFMVLAIISASMAGVMFSVSVPGIIVGRDDERRRSISRGEVPQSVSRIFLIGINGL